MLRDVSPTYLCSLTSLIFTFFSSSPITDSSTLFLSLSSQVKHQVSYITHLWVQSCLNFLPVACFVVHSKHRGRSQSFPCQGSDLCKRSTSFVPVFSTTLNFIPVCLPSSFSASLYLLANSPSIVKGTKSTPTVLSSLLFSSSIFLFLELSFHSCWSQTHPASFYSFP